MKTQTAAQCYVSAMDYVTYWQGATFPREPQTVWAGDERRLSGIADRRARHFTSAVGSRTLGAGRALSIDERGTDD